MFLHITLSTIAFIIVTVVASVVFYKDKESATHRLFLILCLLFDAYIVINFFSLHPPIDTPDAQLFFIRFTMLVTSIIGPAVYLFIHTFPAQNVRMTKTGLLFLLLLGVTSGVASMSQWVFLSLEYPNGMPLPVPGPAIGVFLFDFVGLFVASYVLLVYRYIHADSLAKIRFFILLFGASVSFTLMGVTTVVFVVFLKTSSAVYLGPLFSAFFVCTLAYAIVRYRFFSIHVVLKKSATRKIILLLVTFVFAFIATVAGMVFDSHIFIGFSFFVFILVVKPTMSAVQDFLDGAFFQEELDLSKKLSSDAAELSSTKRLNDYIEDFACRLEEKKIFVNHFFVLQRQHNRLRDLYAIANPSYVSMDALNGCDLATVGTVLEVDQIPQLGKKLQVSKTQYAVPILDDHKILALIICSSNLPKSDTSKILMEQTDDLRVNMRILLYWYESIEGLKRKLNNDMYESV